MLFGTPMDEERYWKGLLTLSLGELLVRPQAAFLVIHQCGLEHDLELLDHGDLTQVGERGITLRYVMSIFTQWNSH